MGEGRILRPLRDSDPSAMEAAFAAIGWNKPASRFETYLSEQASGARWVCVAEVANTFAGYVTVVWEPADPEFAASDTPEIQDLNVLPHARRRGVGSALLDEAEREVSKRSDRVGLRVGLHAGYGSAQRLYVRHGYVPDGMGALYGRHGLGEGAETVLDDELTIRMGKSLSRPSSSGYLRGLRSSVGHELLLVPSIAVIVRDESDRLLMVQDRSTGEWGLPAGAIEPGESPLEAARRELKEEAGIVGSELHLIGGLGGDRFRHVYPNGDRVEYQLFVFATTPADHGSRTDRAEIERVAFFSREDAPPLRLPYPSDMVWGTTR